MTMEEIIDTVLPLGKARGVDALTPAQRRAFLMFEAHANCAIDGIDSFLDAYPSAYVRECAEAFAAAGERDVAEGLRVAAETWPATDHTLLTRTNDAIANYTAQQLASFCANDA
jgi:hypothetical protein